MCIYIFISPHGKNGLFPRPPQPAFSMRHSAHVRFRNSWVVQISVARHRSQDGRSREEQMTSCRSVPPLPLRRHRDSYFPSGSAPRQLCDVWVADFKLAGRSVTLPTEHFQHAHREVLVCPCVIYRYIYIVNAFVHYYYPRYSNQLQEFDTLFISPHGHAWEPMVAWKEAKIHHTSGKSAGCLEKWSAGKIVCFCNQWVN